MVCLAYCEVATYLSKLHEYLIYDTLTNCMRLKPIMQFMFHSSVYDIGISMSLRYRRILSLSMMETSVNEDGYHGA